MSNESQTQNEYIDGNYNRIPFKYIDGDYIIIPYNSFGTIFFPNAEHNLHQRISKILIIDYNDIARCLGKRLIEQYN